MTHIKQNDLIQQLKEADKALVVACIKAAKHPRSSFANRRVSEALASKIHYYNKCFFAGIDIPSEVSPI